MFLPTTKKEVKGLGWDALDVILVSGDSYIDSPYIGVAVIGKVLLSAGYRVAIIAQPDMESDTDITRLGEPALFWGVTAGSVDSMVSNRTASGKKRRTDDFTPGGVNDRRPDRATIKYTNLIRKNFKGTVPIVLGGIEASLRRIAHYDYWSDKIRKSVLFDAKADYLLYGMAESAASELAATLKEGRDPRGIRGLCFISKNIPEEIKSETVLLPSFEDAAADKAAFTKMFNTFYRNNDPVTAKPLAQKHGDRYLIQNPPAPNPTSAELDRIHGLSFERDLHPYYRKDGAVKALETIRFSIPTHRGCYGECGFCAIAVHQGRTVRWRSKKSIVDEARSLASHPLFKGTIHDVGGPTANMYGFECDKKDTEGACLERACLTPKICPRLRITHGPQRKLLKELRGLPGIKKVAVASGLRHDMIIADKKEGEAYLGDLVRHHVSGQMKIAPEHTETRVLELMGKPGPETLLKFRELFNRLTKKAGLKQFLTYYLIAAHPGCTDADMQKLKTFAKDKLGLLPEQVQVFTPTPSTYSTLIYWTGKDPFTGKPVFVERSTKGRDAQKAIVATPARGAKGTHKGKRG